LPPSRASSRPGHTSPKRITAQVRQLPWLKMTCASDAKIDSSMDRLPGEWPRESPSGEESSPKRDHGLLRMSLKQGRQHQAKTPSSHPAKLLRDGTCCIVQPADKTASVCTSTGLLPRGKLCSGKCPSVTPPPALRKIPAFACEGNSLTISFESKVCRTRWQAIARQDREKRLFLERVKLSHSGRPAFTCAGEERLHRQKSNYDESYRRNDLCQAGNWLWGAGKPEKSRIARRTAQFAR
jgi:hypothetical protein